MIKFRWITAGGRKNIAISSFGKGAPNELLYKLVYKRPILFSFFLLLFFNLKKFSFFFWLHCAARRVLAPRPEIEPLPSLAVKAWNPGSPWTARGIP